MSLQVLREKGQVGHCVWETAAGPAGQLPQVRGGLAEADGRRAGGQGRPAGAQALGGGEQWQTQNGGVILFVGQVSKSETVKKDLEQRHGKQVMENETLKKTVDNLEWKVGPHKMPMPAPSPSGPEQ
jgi:hypothetical protein